MTKRYGDSKTDLVLSDKAARIYSECDPLDIIEHEDGSYSIRGIEDRNGMTAEEVNLWLEDLSDEAIEQKYTVIPEYRDLWSNDPEWDGTVDAKEIERLSREWGKSVEELMEQVEEA